MGLDTYASHRPDDIELTEEDLQAFREANISLCGGLFSDDGCDGSFRGKVYAGHILDIAGQSLYAEWIPPETVKEMCQALVDYESMRALDEELFGTAEKAHSDLVKFFKVCTERGLGLVGWS